MDRILLASLDNSYSKASLDLLQALRAWKEARLTPDDIKDQVLSDTGKKITAVEARELHHIGTVLQYDYDSIAKQFEVSKGREDLIPENIKENKIKLSPAIKMSMEKVGENLYRHKTAKTYWTLKEKMGDNGDKAVFLVAIDDPEEGQTKKAEDVAPQQGALPPKKEEPPQVAANSWKDVGPILLGPNKAVEEPKVQAGIRDLGREMRKRIAEEPVTALPPKQEDPTKPASELAANAGWQRGVDILGGGKPKNVETTELQAGIQDQGRECRGLSKS